MKGEGIFSHTWKVHPQTGTALDEKEVEVQLKVVKESYAIELTRYLRVDGYQLQAELTPSTNRPFLPNPLPTGESRTESLQWKVGWITTGEEKE